MVNHHHLRGKGALLRDPTRNPPAVRRILTSIGDELVTSVQLIRTPLSTFSRSALNIASFNALTEAQKKAGVDKFFHLAAWINGKYLLDKQDVIHLERDKNPIKSNSETLIVPIPATSNTTIQKMLDNTMAQMGPQYGPYDPISNNCSVFVSNVLSSNGWSNDMTNTFVNQRVEDVFDKFPHGGVTHTISRAATDLAAFLDRQLNGEGIKHHTL
jgi:hypothetical protein